MDENGILTEMCSAAVDIFRLRADLGRLWLGFTASTELNTEV